MTDRDHPVSLHQQHVNLLREVLATQQDLIEVLNMVADQRESDDASNEEHVYR